MRLRGLAEQAFHTPAHTAWSEYGAQRKSARFNPQDGAHLIEMLRQVIHELEGHVQGDMRRYREDGDKDALWRTARERVNFLFQAFGYALGHVDGLFDINSEFASTYRSELEALGERELGRLVLAARDDLKVMDETADWASGVEPYRALMERVKAVFHHLGFYPMDFGQFLLALREEDGEIEGA